MKDVFARAPRIPSADRPWIKVCGVRSISDLNACAHSGATHVGVNTWPGSPRYVPEDRVPILISAAREMGLAPVLLTLPGSSWENNDIGRWGVEFLQLISPISGDRRQRLAKGGTKIIEARRTQMETIARKSWGDVLLLDAYVQGALGGTGRSFPWRVALQAPRPFVLAGGLGPHNVVDAIAACAPWGVDAATGLESHPGFKDPGRIREFCAAAREGFLHLPGVTRACRTDS